MGQDCLKNHSVFAYRLTQPVQFSLVDLLCCCFDDKEESVDDEEETSLSVTTKAVISLSV